MSGHDECNCDQALELRALVKKLRCEVALRKKAQAAMERAVAKVLHELEGLRQ